MRILLALPGSPKMVAVPWDDGWRDFLVAFPYKNALEGMQRPDLFMLDSGAFTAWAVGDEVDFDAYERFAVERTELWPGTHVVNLDVIPGEAGRDSTPQERLAGMAQSVKNADRLRAAGLRVMEVFHQDEPLTFLHELLDRRRPGELLGISPRNDVPIAAKLRWQGIVLRALVERCGRDGLPPCHGLGFTNARMANDFPYFSIDSSTWAVPWRFGQMLDGTSQVPIVKVYGNGEGTLSGGVPEQNEVLEAGIRSTMRALATMRDEATAIWRARGIVWNVNDATLEAR